MKIRNALFCRMYSDLWNFRLPLQIPETLAELEQLYKPGRIRTVEELSPALRVVGWFMDHGKEWQQKGGPRELNEAQREYFLRVVDSIEETRGFCGPGA